jgi:hypothetical protein
MKTLFVTVGGTMTPGDLLMIRYVHRTLGGVSALKYRVPPPVDSIEQDAKGNKKVVTKSATPADAVKAFLDELNCGQSWPLNQFQGVARENGTQLMVKCNDENSFADIVFEVEVEGAKTETISFEVV